MIKKNQEINYSKFYISFLKAIFGLFVFQFIFNIEIIYLLYVVDGSIFINYTVLMLLSTISFAFCYSHYIGIDTFLLADAERLQFIP